jgi:hypothetical protein
MQFITAAPAGKQDRALFACFTFFWGGTRAFRSSRRFPREYLDMRFCHKAGVFLL